MWAGIAGRMWAGIAGTMWAGIAERIWAGIAEWCSERSWLVVICLRVVLVRVSLAAVVVGGTGVVEMFP